MILGLGSQVLESLDATSRADIGDLIVNQRITVRSAEANFENAKLTREIAEIAIVEYQEGIFKQDEATLDGEVKLAEADAARAGDHIEFARGQLAMIKKASRGTAEDLSLEYAYEDRIVQAEQRVPKTRLALEKARSKLDALRKYGMPRRVKELKAEVEKARLDELAKQAVWELEKIRLKKMQEASKGQDREPHHQRVLSLLDQTLPLAEQIKTKLEKAEQDQNSARQFRNEITAGLDQLQTLVEQAQAEYAAAKWAKLKPKIQAASVRYLGANAK